LLLLACAFSGETIVIPVRIQGIGQSGLIRNSGQGDDEHAGRFGLARCSIAILQRAALHDCNAGGAWL